MQVKSNRRVLIPLIAALVLAAAAFTAAYLWFRPQPVTGAKEIQIEVVHGGGTKTHTINTDAEYLRQALEENKLIEGEELSFGLMVTTVDGITVDSAKNEWWCITKSGEWLMTGVDDTPIENGDRYEITLTAG